MSKPLRILALDLSASGTGWADSQGRSGVEGFSLRRGESPGMRWIRFKAWLEKLVQKVKPDVIAYEQAHHRGGHPTHVAHSLIAIVEQVVAEVGDIELTNRHTGQIKKHATGHGKASKEMMIESARENWWDKEIFDDNEADALWLLDLVEKEIGE